MISWPPTNSEYGSGVRPRGSLYRDPTSFLSGANEPAATSNPDITNDSRISDSGVLETQETQSFNYSDTSSISRFPTFHFNIHTISTLDQLTGSGVGPGYFRGKKHNFLLAIVEVDGPETITLKKGPDAGKQIGLLKLILGDEAGNACKLTAWRDVAEEWGGVGKAVGCKRGDVVYIESSFERPVPAAPTPTHCQHRRHGGMRAQYVANVDSIAEHQIQDDSVL